MKTATKTMREVRDFIRQPYAWPGGYPLTLVMSDGEYLCAKCARSEYRLVSTATRHGLRDGWQAAGVAINWEDGNATCAHCGESIQCAIGDTLTAMAGDF